MLKGWISFHAGCLWWCFFRHNPKLRILLAGWLLLGPAATGLAEPSAQRKPGTTAWVEWDRASGRVVSASRDGGAAYHQQAGA